MIMRQSFSFLIHYSELLIDKKRFPITTEGTPPKISSFISTPSFVNASYMLSVLRAQVQFTLHYLISS